VFLRSFNFVPKKLANTNYFYVKHSSRNSILRAGKTYLVMEFNGSITQVGIATTT
jgi:hypothetical protein